MDEREGKGSVMERTSGSISGFWCRETPVHLNSSILSSAFFRGDEDGVTVTGMPEARALP
jgi:hypothetical protein